MGIVMHVTGGNPLTARRRFPPRNVEILALTCCIFLDAFPKCLGSVCGPIRGSIPGYPSITFSPWQRVGGFHQANFMPLNVEMLTTGPRLASKTIYDGTNQASTSEFKWELREISGLNEWRQARARTSFCQEELLLQHEKHEWKHSSGWR